MPDFNVKGIGLKTNRRRNKEYCAYDEQDVRDMALKDGTKVESIERLPTKPATQSQLKYAHDLNINIPPAADINILSDLIAYAVEDDSPLTELDKQMALLYKKEITAYTGRKTLYERLFHHFKNDQDEMGLLCWYIFNVYLDLTKNNLPDDVASPDATIINKCALQMSKDPGNMNSFRRIEAHDYVRFGQWTDNKGATIVGGNRNAKAYKSAKSILAIEPTEPVSVPPAMKQASKQVVQHEDKQRTLSSAKGCFGVLAMMVLLPISLGAFYVWTV